MFSFINNRFAYFYPFCFNIFVILIWKLRLQSVFSFSTVKGRREGNCGVCFHFPLLVYIVSGYTWERRNNFVKNANVQCGMQSYCYHVILIKAIVMPIHCWSGNWLTWRYHDVIYFWYLWKFWLTLSVNFLCYFTLDD